MATAGPELPPHLLAKRKRLEEAEVSSSAQGNTTEGIPTAFNSSATSDSPKRQRILGPSLPDSENSEHISSDKDDFKNLRGSDGGEGVGRDNDYSKPRILGPSLPPAPLSERPSSPLNLKDPPSDDDDDDFGPSLPPASTSQTRISESTAKPSVALDRAAPKPKREEWMLVPPSQSDWSSRVDPTKLRNRKFNTGKGAKAPPPKSSGDNALWTETPEEKQKRLADEVMGVVAKGGSATVSSSSAYSSNLHEQNPRKRSEALETERRIQAYNAQNRSASLYSEHQKRPRKEQEDDPSCRAFDREKDLVRGTKIGRAQKQELLNRAADFGERFTKGSYL